MVIFTKAVSGGSVDGTTFKVSDSSGAITASSITTAGDGLSATFGATLSSGTAYTVELTSGITSLIGGQPLIPHTEVVSY